MSNKSKFKGVSLIETLIALAILLAVLFMFFILFDALIAKDYSLNKKIQESDNLQQAAAEMKIAGVASAVNVGATDNGDGTNTIQISSKENSSNALLNRVVIIANKPQAKLNLISCNNKECTLNAEGSIADSALYSYSSTGNNVIISPETTSNASQNIEIQYSDYGQYEVTLTVSDKYGIKDNKTIPVTVSPPPLPNPVLNFGECNASKCTFNASGTTIYTDKATYTYSFDGGADDIVTTEINQNVVAQYTSYGSKTVSLKVVDEAGQEAMVTKDIEVYPFDIELRYLPDYLNGTGYVIDLIGQDIVDGTPVTVNVINNANSEYAIGVQKWDAYASGCQSTLAVNYNSFMDGYGSYYCNALGGESSYKGVGILYAGQNPVTIEVSYLGYSITQSFNVVLFNE
ncbi:type II secretion system protein J [Pseudofrancisella aestuarii]|uniref:Type II secretion system protein J n=1 Tax=Pseudofrancisella aestuarii TaxID=2670347 RepID=A0ABV9TBY9_9GAMM